MNSAAPNGAAPNEFGATQMRNRLKPVNGWVRSLDVNPLQWVLRALAPNSFSVLLALSLAACSGPPQLPAGSCTLNLPAGTSDDDAISAVIHAEGQLVVEQKIDALMALWTDGASITNAKNTPDAADDDQYWRDKDAIRHRYVRMVFPGAPAQASPADLKITRDGDQATVIATTHIGSEVSPAGDRWTLRKQGSCWLLENLTYNLEPQP